MLQEIHDATSKKHILDQFFALNAFFDTKNAFSAKNWSNMSLFKVWWKEENSEHLKMDPMDIVKDIGIIARLSQFIFNLIRMDNRMERRLQTGLFLVGVALYCFYIYHFRM